MKIAVWVIGKTKPGPYKTLLDDFLHRLKRYQDIDYQEIILNYKKVGNDPEVVKKHEASQIISRLDHNYAIILMDEHGKTMSSVKLSEFIERGRVSNRSYLFIIGGAYGFHQDIIQKSHMKISLSAMTFTHQMARILLLEQLYRGYTILAHEPYHNT